MIATAFDSLDRAYSAMVAQEQAFRTARDRRAVFLTVYRITTGRMKQAIADGRFADNEWVKRYTIAFADLYRDALWRHLQGQGAGLPRAWRWSFDTSYRGQALVAQDLLLGVNAHINYDLAFALHAVGIGPDRQARYNDHVRVNEILHAIADEVQQCVAVYYAPGLTHVDAAAGALDEEAAGFSIVHARDAAWEAAVALTNAQTEFERGFVRKRIDLQSGALARLILSPNRSAALLNALRTVEQGKDWRTCLPPL